MVAVCRCADRSNIRSLEESDWGFPAKVEPLDETPVALLGRCRQCGTWWERLPHWVYGYAWYRTEQRYWGAHPRRQPGTMPPLLRRSRPGRHAAEDPPGR